MYIGIDMKSPVIHLFMLSKPKRDEAEQSEKEKPTGKVEII
jgi:hypothetical protein